MGMIVVVVEVDVEGPKIFFFGDVLLVFLD